MEKFFPKVGDKLYLYQRTGNCWVDEVKRPYTVTEVTPRYVYVQSCKLIFNGVRYYDTLPDDIQEDPNGRIIKLTWAHKKGVWQESDPGGYPQMAKFGRWEYQPYLN